MRLQTFIVAFLLSTTAGAVRAQCVSQLYPRNSAGSIGVVPADFYISASDINGAIGKWARAHHTVLDFRL